MAEYNFRGINDAFPSLVGGVRKEVIPTITEETRNGRVKKFAGTTTVVTYSNPKDRVLLNRSRDCNPFFHLYEALWMLAGRDDVEPLKYYNSNMVNYSDDGKTFNAAYGKRWRDWYGIDQLTELVEHIREFPITRRAVLAIWDPVRDLLRVDDRNKNTEYRGRINPGQSKDTACNVIVKFNVSNGKLHMNVHNRSNDMIWGMMGANVVHFSMLHEYMACSTGYDLGTYTQITDDLHIYENNWKPSEWLAPYENRDAYSDPCCVEQLRQHKHVPLVYDKEDFDGEVKLFVDEHYQPEKLTGKEYYEEPFLSEVANPMCQAFHMHKQRDYRAAHLWMSAVAMKDWAMAGLWWLEKREQNWKEKNEQRASPK